MRTAKRRHVHCKFIVVSPDGVSFVSKFKFSFKIREVSQ